MDDATQSGAEQASKAKLGDDWPDKALGLIDLVVDTINDRVVRPIVLVGRSIVFGLLIAAVLIVTGVAVGVAVLRLLDVYAFTGHVWASYTVLGLLFSAVGLVFWAKRSAREPGA